MKFKSLKHLNDWQPRDNRPKDAAKILASLRFPRQSMVRDWRLTDAEIERVLIENNRALIERGGTVITESESIRAGKKHDWSAERTVPLLGWAVLRNGWSIVPQDRPDKVGLGTGGLDRKASYSPAERRPSLIPQEVYDKSKRKTRRFDHAFLPSEWKERRMSLHEFLPLEDLWNSNLAIQCCAASGHIRALDVDCLDADVSAAVKRIAFETLGETPFIRYGKRPKVQLLYRVEGTDIEIRKWALSIKRDGDDAEDGPQNAVEFLAEGSMLTAYGLHHTTFQSFDWSEGSLHPAIAGPEHAPLITREMLRKFTNALQREFDIRGNAVASNPFGSKAAVTNFDRVSGSRADNLWLPRLQEGAEWTLDEDGNVLNGAEKWLTALTWAYVGANAERLDTCLPDLLEHAQLEAKMRLLSVKRDNAALNSEGAVARAVKYKIETAARKFRASIEAKSVKGRFHKGVIPWTISDDGRRPVPQRVRPAERPKDGSLDWLPSDSCPVDELAESVPASTVRVDKTVEQVEKDRNARALIEDLIERHAVADGVSSKVDAYIGDWMSTVSAWHEADDKLPAAPWVLKAPTGAGKTVKIIGRSAQWCRENPRQEGQGPVLLVLPTHANGDEAMRTAMAEGMFNPAETWTEEDLDRLEAAGRGVGVKIARFRGRLAAGCQRADELKSLSEKGIGASNLCGAKVEDGDSVDRAIARKKGEKLGKKEILCPFRERGECGYYQQMSDLKDADIVIVAHAYLTLSALPKDLKNPRAVIVDESTTYQLLQQRRMPISILRSARKPPFVTKSDRKRWPEWSDEDIEAHYVGGREELCAHVLSWVENGKDVAVELMALPNGVDLIECAVVVCDRANDRSRKVRPDLTPSQIKELADEPTGKHLWDEIQWWKLVRARLQSQQDDAAAEATKGEPLTLDERTAKGKRDMRWQVVMMPETDEKTGSTQETPHLRLSWRRKPNWVGVPMLLLDASAKPAIVSKVFGADPVVREVTAPLHGRTVALIERTWSNASFVPKWDASREELKKLGETIDEARKLITTTAVMYGHGRVLVGTTIAVREVLTGSGWAPPPNVDFVHFGALRGLDFAKAHVAAISIGRSEMPIGVVDGYAAALTYDDDVPEEPYDILGTGITVEGKPLFRKGVLQKIEMRTGQDVEHMVPSMPRRPVKNKFGGHSGDFEPSWATLLEESWREEEIRQFVGRLRLVYRGVAKDGNGNPLDVEPPLWIAVGKIIPEGLIVDEITEMKAILKISPMADLARLSGGVLAPNVTPHVPGAQAILKGRTMNQIADDTLPRDKIFLKRFAGVFMHAKYTVASGSGQAKSAMLLPAFAQGDPIAHWQALSEKYGELPDVMSVSEPTIAAIEGKAKPLDSRDYAPETGREVELQLLEAKSAIEGTDDMTDAEFDLLYGFGHLTLPESLPPAE